MAVGAFLSSAAEKQTTFGGSGQSEDGFSERV